MFAILTVCFFGDAVKMEKWKKKWTASFESMLFVFYIMVDGTEGTNRDRIEKIEYTSMS